MKTSLVGCLSNAADLIDELSKDCVEESDAGYYSFALREIAKHAEETAAGKYSVAEFAEHYCLTKKAGAK